MIASAYGHVTFSASMSKMFCDRGWSYDDQGNCGIATVAALTDILAITSYPHTISWVNSGQS